VFDYTGNAIAAVTTRFIHRLNLTESSSIPEAHTALLETCRDLSCGWVPVWRSETGALADGASGAIRRSHNSRLYLLARTAEEALTRPKIFEIR
jgi:hypothetical protein